MGLVFLIVFTLAEIALVVLTFTKFREKAAWRKNRAVIRAAEAVLMLGIILVPAVHMKWRFFGALFVLAVRLLIAGIVWLVMRRRNNGVRKKPWTIISCIVSVSLIAASLAPAFIFSNYNGLPATGGYAVRQTDAVLVDESRADGFENDGSFAEVPAHFFYPDTNEGSFPLIVFSHGAFGYYQSNYSTYAELAGNGYIVAALDHPHHAAFTKNTEGKIITVDQQFINDAMEIGGGDDLNAEKTYTVSKEWLALRTADEGFVIDSVKAAKQSGTLSGAWHADDETLLLSVIGMTDTDKIGAMGHSLGGAAGVALGRERDDVDTVIDLDGTVLGEITGVKDGKFVCNPAPYPVPVLVFVHGTSSDDGDTPYMVDQAKDGKLVFCPKANHMDFTDLSMLSPFISSMLSGKSGVNSEAFMQEINGAVLNWFDYYLKNEGTLSIQAQYE